LSRLFEASVKENRRLTEKHYLLTFNPLKKIRRPGPGNFFMISAGNGLDPLLKRPFSLHRRTGSGIRILYRVTGRGTAILSRKRPGDVLEIIGPLGNGFPARRAGENTILVAGGVGIAPVFALAEHLAASAKKPVLFYGAKTGSDLLCIDELKSIGIEPRICTDTGDTGRKGPVTGMLREFLGKNPSFSEDCCIYACGPESMLRSLSALAGEYGLRGYAALEQNMACGIGACLGCIVNTTRGYKRVCRDGPVFPLNEIIW